MIGRPTFEPSEKDRKAVKTMASLGCKHDDIATLLRISSKTLRKHFREELDCGAIEANNEVMGSLFKMATSGTNTAASIFWAKTRCGLREKQAEPPRSGDVREFVVRVE